MLLTLATVVTLAAPPERCTERARVPPEAREAFNEFIKTTTDGGMPVGVGDPLAAFLHHEPQLADWHFVYLAQLFADDACTRHVLNPVLERRARACTRDACELLNGLLFRSDIVRAIEHDGPKGPSVFDYEVRVLPAGDAGLRVTVVSLRNQDGGVAVSSDVTRVDPAAEVMRSRGTLRLPVSDGDTPTTFGETGQAPTWRSGTMLEPASALAACVDGTLRPLGRFLGVRAVWQSFPEGWTRQFEYQLPCSARFVVPATHGIRSGRWQNDPVTPGDESPSVRRFGAVWYRQTGGSVYDMRCTIDAKVDGTTRSTQLRSSYGCVLNFAADFNRDGLADVVVHMGGESCEHDFLFVSGPSGWTKAGSRGSCE